MPKTLDDKGRCCGRKPLVYKRSHGPDHPRGLFCTRCDRKFDLETGEQIENWAWKKRGGDFVRINVVTGEPKGNA